jgi:protein SCO1/2
VRDTPKVLKAYAERFHVAPGWLFLTGKPEDIKLVTRKLGLFFEPDPGNRDGHTADLMIGDVAGGQWMRDSAVDNPRFLAMKIGEFLAGPSDDTSQPGKSYAQAPELSLANKGQYLFANRCAACHSIGRGERVGPDLAGVTRRRDQAWLKRYLAAPDRMLAAGDPIARALDARYGSAKMPNLRLGEADVTALVDYLAEQQGPAVTGDGTAPAPAAATASAGRQ